MWIYTLILIPTTLLLVYLLGVLGIVYGVTAVGLGGVFIKKNWQLLQALTPQPSPLFLLVELMHPRSHSKYVDRIPYWHDSRLGY
jgi:heme O synthase-like polyprenyltransferase